MQQEYDYIIAGAGSAGCVLAERLSRCGNYQVLLLEAGGKDSNPMIHIPLAAAALQETAVDWGYVTQPEPELNNRRIKWPRGKVLGGSSSINGMLYIRGQAADYDNWAAQGNTGWSYQDLLPYFKQHEHNVAGANNYHGQGGPLWVDAIAGQFDMAEQFVEAGQQVGLPHNTDFNSEQQEGVGYYSVNIKNGVRQSSVSSHLKPALKRTNLKVVTNALVEKVVIENNRARGVEASIKGTPQSFTATREVLLSGGAINSPQLLQLSGIGDKAHLSEVGVTLVHHLPGVGQNLQDHLTVNICFNIQDSTTYHDEMKPLKFLKHIVEYAFKRTGLLSFPSAQVGAFFKTDDSQPSPNAQIHFAPAAAEYDKNGKLVPKPGCTATVCNLRPNSRGSVKIVSASADDKPQITANYLQDTVDQQVMLDAVKKTRSIFQADVLKPYGGYEMTPGKGVKSDAEIMEYIRKDAVSVYHPVGSCKMGSDEWAVVDSELKVHGIDGLRVADASIMPQIISGNTHAACVVIAEKCADSVLGLVAR